MKNISILFFAFILSSINLNAQETFEEISSLEIDLGVGDPEKFQSVVDRLYLFVGVSLDSTDIDMLSDPSILGMFMVKVASNPDVDLTYGNLYNEFVAFKLSKEYQPFRAYFEITVTLETLPADIANWDEDRKLFEKIGVPKDKLEEIKQRVEANTDPTKTYQDILSDIAEGEEENRSEFQELFENKLAIDIEKLLEQSKEQNKPIILYFTGFGCVNCRKIEHSVISDPDIYAALRDDFIFVSLYVDVKTELPEEEQYESEVRNKSIVTVGDKNFDYQMTNFNVSSQPHFVVLNSSNQVLAESKYEISIDTFYNFLLSGLDKFRE